jgi:dehydrogenase/reductase SDR family protein 12
LDLNEHVFMVTGANSGVGKEVARFLASKGGAVYMVCRSQARAEAARKELEEETGNSKIYVLLADLSLENDVRKCWQEFLSHRESLDCHVRLDALVCNGGVLLNEKTLSSDGIEVTFASHFLFGTYLLGCLAMPVLECTLDSRLVVVSSGGMYNTKWPDWETATSTGTASYSGNLAYAYAKRGQVLLMERWAVEHPEVNCVSCHPGWTDTPAVDEAYGSQKRFLEPLRTPWQGSEGIAWLCVAPGTQLESGAFYLDRTPRTKHMAGAFFTEGSFTKNTPAQVDDMISRLAETAHEVLAPSVSSMRLSQRMLCAMPDPIERSRFMGRWYVLANIPTFADKNTINNTEDYVWDEAKGVIKVKFGYSKAKNPKKRYEILQRAAIKNTANTEWAINPKFGIYLPIGIPYLIVHCAEDYSTAIIAVPDRKYIWIMSRSTSLEDSELEALFDKAQTYGYDTSKIVKVPQIWEDVPHDLDEAKGA